MNAQDHGPGVRLPPPAVVAGLLALAWGLERVLPVPLGPPLPDLGALVIFAAAGLIGWALLVMLKAGNDPRPDRPDSAMVEAGPYRFSRNPIYLGLILGALGFALRWGDLWGWIAVAGSHLVLDRLVVAKEEAYLAARFGTAYETYRSRVRRWI